PVGDLALPLALAEPDLLLPLQLVIALLLDAQDAVHELREGVELRPRLVCAVDRNGYVGPALDRQAPRLLAAAAIVAAAQGFPGELSHHPARALRQPIL